MNNHTADGLEMAQVDGSLMVHVPGSGIFKDPTEWEQKNPKNFDTQFKTIEASKNTNPIDKRRKSSAASQNRALRVIN